MTELQRIEEKLDLIIHHLNINGDKPVDINQVRKDAEKDVLRFQEKKRKKGHESIQTTQIYTKVNLGHMDEAIKRCWK
jgi:hypothetical protein